MRIASPLCYVTDSAYYLFIQSTSEKSHWRHKKESYRLYGSREAFPPFKKFSWPLISISAYEVNS
jgi:hypothetical protein